MRMIKITDCFRAWFLCAPVIEIPALEQRRTSLAMGLNSRQKTQELKSRITARNGYHLRNRAPGIQAPGGHGHIPTSTTMAANCALCRSKRPRSTRPALKNTRVHHNRQAHGDLSARRTYLQNSTLLPQLCPDLRTPEGLGRPGYTTTNTKKACCGSCHVAVQDKYRAPRLPSDNG